MRTGRDLSEIIHGYIYMLLTSIAGPDAVAEGTTTFPEEVGASAGASTCSPASTCTCTWMATSCKCAHCSISLSRQANAAPTSACLFTGPSPTSPRPTGYSFPRLNSLKLQSYHSQHSKHCMEMIKSFAKGRRLHGFPPLNR